MPFAPGQSGNPGGRRPKGFTDFREECRKYSPEALQALVTALADPDRSVQAATTLLGYAWGRPPQALTGEGGDGPVRIVVTIADAGPEPEGEGAA